MPVFYFVMCFTHLNCYVIKKQFRKKLCLHQMVYNMQATLLPYLEFKVGIFWNFLITYQPVLFFSKKGSEFGLWQTRDLMLRLSFLKPGSLLIPFFSSTLVEEFQLIVGSLSKILFFHFFDNDAMVALLRLRGFFFESIYKDSIGECELSKLLGLRE